MLLIRKYMIRLCVSSIIINISLARAGKGRRRVPVIHLMRILNKDSAAAFSAAIWS